MIVGDSSGRRRSVAAWIVAGITLAVFLPAVFNDFVDWDDLPMIVQNPRFNPPTWSGVGRFWTTAEMDIYMPLTQTVWAAVAMVARTPEADENGANLNPYLFHAVNIVVHTISALLVYSILQQLVANRAAAAVGAAIFAVHPLQVEAVAWVPGLKDVLSGMFYLAALRVWIAPTRRPWIATILFVLAMLAKPSAVGLPLATAALEIFVLCRPIKVTIVRLLPWMALSGAFAMVARCVQPAPLVQVPVHLRPIVAADALIFYLRKICWPGAMGVDYGRTPQAVLATNWLWPCIALLALVVIVLLLRRRFPVLLAAAAVFLVGLIPVLGLARFEFQHFSTVADHYLYVAMLGPALVGAWLAAKGGNGSAGWTLRTIVIATIFAMLIVRTETQIRVWRNGVTLFSHAVVVNPNSWMSWSNLGNALAPTRPQEAIEACERAAEINPDDANNWNSLGSILMSQGERSAAVDAFARAWKLAPENPMYSANYRRAAAAMR